MRALLLSLILLCVSMVTAHAQSWLDVFNRYRVAQASDWVTPNKILRNDLRPFVTLSRRNQPCQDCRIDELSDAGRFALAMQGQGSRKDSSVIRSPKGETLLTARDMEFLRMHAWDGAGKVFIGATTHSKVITPQSLVMGMVTQIGVRARALAVGFSDQLDDSLVWGYRLLPLAEGDIGEAYARDGNMVYPVVLRFNIYVHEVVEDASLPVFDFQSGRDQVYNKRTRVGRNTSALTLKAEFLFDQAVQITQNGFRAEGHGRLVDQGRWLDDHKIEYLWIANTYGSTASEHPALTPKALKLIEAGNWNAPELTKRLTTLVQLKRAHDVFAFLEKFDMKDDGEILSGTQQLIAKKIEHHFYRSKMAVKVWPESVQIPTSLADTMSLRMTFYSNYDQSKVIKNFEEMGFFVDFSDSF